jgi:hypothetical protein
MDMGYVLLFEASRPNARKDGYVAEHTKVMAANLGRPLHRFEEVATRTGSVMTTGQRTWSCGHVVCSRQGVASVIWSTPP